LPPGSHVAKEHVDGGLELVDEAATSGVVRQLLGGEAHLDGGPQVDVCLIGDPDSTQNWKAPAGERRARLFGESDALSTWVPA
jgi:hypothetical protein